MRNKNLLWYQMVKPKVSPKQIKTYNMSPIELLVRADYIMLPTGGFFKEIDPTHRYHAYIVGEDKIELHTDLIKVHPKNKHKYHVASTYLGVPEKRRLREIDPVPEQVSKKKRNIEIKKIMDNKYPPDKKRQILDELKLKGLIK